VYQKEEEWNGFLRDKPKLELARRKSLPANPETAVSEYIGGYLRPMLAECGLGEIDLTHSAPAEMKPAVVTAGVKKVGHQLITFTVKAKGELESLVRALEILQETPYEHRVKSMTISRADNNGSKLNITMLIETLLVAKSEGHPHIPPGIDSKYLILDGIAGRIGSVPLGWGLLGSTAMIKMAMPQPHGRNNYEQMRDKNIFVDPTKRVSKDPSEREKKEAPEEDVPKYIRLVTTDPTNQTAYLRNFVYKTREQKLIAKSNSGYEFFRVTDEDGDYEYFKGKALRVGPREVYFQVKDEVYRIHIGQSLRDALDAPTLSVFQLDDLEIDRDEAMVAAARKNKSAKESPTKTKTPPSKKGGKGG
jgi:hypothetical protein